MGEVRTMAEVETSRPGRWRRVRALVVLTGVLSLGAGLSAPSASAAEPARAEVAVVRGEGVERGATKAETAPAERTQVQPTSIQQVEAGGVRRWYRLHVPAATREVSEREAGRPLVVALHGRHQLVSSILSYSGLEELGAQEGFVTAFPQALGGGWNAGLCCDTGSLTQTRDVEFLDEVIRDAAAHTPVDLHRVYVVGFSNGGMLAYRYGCERAGKVAGVGVVGGVMTADAAYGVGGGQACRPGKPVGLFHLHGDQDRLVSPHGGYQESLQAATASLAESVGSYTQAGGCQGSEPGVRGSAKVRTWGGCAGGASVQLVRVPALGHEWTRSGYGVDTSSLMWEFLSPQRSSAPAAAPKLSGAPQPGTPAPASSAQASQAQTTQAQTTQPDPGRGAPQGAEGEGAQGALTTARTANPPIGEPTQPERRRGAPQGAEGEGAIALSTPVRTAVPAQPSRSSPAPEHSARDAGERASARGAPAPALDARAGPGREMSRAGPSPGEGGRASPAPTEHEGRDGPAEIARGPS